MRTRQERHGMQQLVARVLGGAVLLGFLACSLPTRAQGTKQWTVERYDEFERGSSEGVAIRNDGRLEPGMTVTTLYGAPESYVWAMAQSAQGEVYAGLGGISGGSAMVVRLPSRGSPEKIFLGKELGVQAVRVAANGAVYAATSPDGRVYRLLAGEPTGQVVFDPATTAEKPKYLWDLAVAPDGTLFVATGAPAAVYRLPQGASTKPELLFRTADAHIRSLLLSPGGVLWAGSDGAGVVYRFDTKTNGAKPFAAYAAAHREITALAMDESGALYAAAVGAKGPSSLPPLPVTGSVGVTVTFLQPGSTTAAGTNTVIADGSEIDRIAPDGTPQRLVSLHEDVVYALQAGGGKVLAATGNRGRIYQIDPLVAGRLTELARLEAGQGTAMASGPEGLLVGASNSGKVFRLQPATRASYTSEVFDAGQFSRWGRTETQTDGPAFDLYLRTGNVPSTILGWSDWLKTTEAGRSLPGAAPTGRYAQWRADLRPGGAIDSVTLNYLPRNVAPVVDEVVVVPGARIAAAPPNQQPPTLQVVFPGSGTAAAQAISLVQGDANAGPLTAQKDRAAVTVRWSAHDDNGDDLMFSVLYRGVGETNWHLLRDKISERYLSFDSALLPDGRYEAKVEASDAPVHTGGETLTGERASTTFTIDTTPPVPGPLTTKLEGATVHWTLEVNDAVSAIGHAEYSLDAGPWQYVEPVGALSDSLQERYDARVPIEDEGGSASRSVGNLREHVLAVRVYDRAENMMSVKAVVR